ncbi:MAG TPA: cbb3-type cytochrome oxidase assembly protein CcoS [Devosia sp.]|jgi:cbb3-type cytochrome oxidase maturation protein|nr:cbb3-type cytochrome oxidase assembly protein CcoS [Devosia sp.]
MTGLLFLVPIALAMGIGALVVFLWSVRSGQYDDLEGASQRIFEEDLPPRK